MKTFAANFMHYRFLLVELVKKGIKLKYRRSYLGILWTLLEPLLTMIVLTVIFGGLLGHSDRLYPIYILTGRLLYSCFSTGTRSALKSIRSNSGMIKKVYVPKYMYPLSGIIYNYIIFLISLIVLFAVGLVLGLRPNWSMLLLPIPLLVALLLTMGVGMILATYSVFFRDLEYIWSVLTMLIMYGSAIFYHVDDIVSKRPEFRIIFDLNPLYDVIRVFRDMVFGDPISWGLCLYAFLFSMVALALGTYAFFKKQDEFILYI